MKSLVECSCDRLRSRKLPVVLELLVALPGLLTLALGGCENEMGGGQDGRVATLELDAAYPEPFSYLSGVRELSDGTILAADPTSQVLLRLDLDAGTADTLGRHGPGPQEYDGPDQVFPLPGDSTLLVDLGNGRLVVIDPEGRFVDWTPMTTPTADGRGRTVHPNFVDAAGNLYDGGPYSPEGPPDTTAVHKIVRATGEETRVAAAWHTPYVRRQAGEKRPMLTPYDDWAVGSDGRVAVVRANGYSVDWYFQDGRVVQGPTNETETFPMGLPEKEAALEHAHASGISSYSEVSEAGLQSLRMSRGIPAGSFPGIDGLAWPENLPVFRVGETLVSPRGEVWVHRMMPAGGPGRVEVFDEQAIRVGFIDLPPRSQVIGFAGQGEPASRVYVTRTDDVGLVWLERYRVSGVGGRR
jgi:hypothetical protein